MDIVYSTEISEKIKRLYQEYMYAAETYPKWHVKRNRAFLKFADACDKEGKDVLATFDTLNK